MPPSPSAPSGGRPRIEAIDFLRGLVMVVMALDHTRGFFSNVTFYPMDLEKTWPSLFLTRWITHYCAPVFVFLAGTGAFLSARRGRTPTQVCTFLLSRGLWLVFLELTLVRFGWNFDWKIWSQGVGVIWAIGWSMVILSAVQFLPTPAVTLFGLAMIFGHNALDGIKPDAFGSFDWLWMILHTGGRIQPAEGWTLGVGYPLIPWIGVMAAGYGFGALYSIEPEKRRRWLITLGCSLIALFFLLRGSNIYGDPAKWTEQKSALFNLFAMLHCQKYPPSLCYLLMTLGPAMLVLWIMEKNTGRWTQPFVMFGRVPLFYYLLHLPLIHGLAIIIAKIRHNQIDFLIGSTGAVGRPPGYGFDLPGVYLVWIAVILILYPVCNWFMGYKKRNPSPWLSYL